MKAMVRYDRAQHLPRPQTYQGLKDLCGVEWRAGERFDNSNLWPKTAEDVPSRHLQNLTCIVYGDPKACPQAQGEAGRVQKAGAPGTVL